MNTVTIPKSLARKGDLVVIPSAVYEDLKSRAVPVVKATKSELKAFARAERNYKAGKTITLDELFRKLDR